MIKLRVLLRETDQPVVLSGYGTLRDFLEEYSRTVGYLIVLRSAIVNGLDVLLRRTLGRRVWANTRMFTTQNLIFVVDVHGEHKAKGKRVIPLGVALKEILRCEDGLVVFDVDNSITLTPWEVTTLREEAKAVLFQFMDGR